MLLSCMLECMGEGKESKDGNSEGGEIMERDFT
jgi:hypothetical protein